MQPYVKKVTCHGVSTCKSCTHTHNPLLSGIKVNDRSILDEARTVIEFKKGDLLYREGIHPSGLMCLNTGKVMITKKDQYDNAIIVGLQREVSFLGVADYISDSPYQTDCTALEDCIVCMIKRENVNELLGINKFFAKNMMDEVTRQLHVAHERLLSLTKKHMHARLADALYLLQRVFGTKKDGKTLDIYMKRKDLASLSNMNISNVIRHLSTFQREGIIEIEGKEIIINDLDKLQKLRHQI